MKTHVLVGSVEGLSVIKEAATQIMQVTWIVPKTAKPLDRALFYVHGKGLVGSGEIHSQVTPSEAWGAGWYEADIQNVRWFKQAISLEDLQGRIPKWKWTTYPRAYTTPRHEIEKELLEYLASKKIKLKD